MDERLADPPHDGMRGLHAEARRLVHEGHRGGAHGAQGQRENEPHEQDHQGVEPEREVRWKLRKEEECADLTWIPPLPPKVVLPQGEEGDDGGRHVEGDGGAEAPEEDLAPDLEAGGHGGLLRDDGRGGDGLEVAGQGFRHVVGEGPVPGGGRHLKGWTGL